MSEGKEGRGVMYGWIKEWTGLIETEEAVRVW